MATAARAGPPSAWNSEPLGKLGRWIGGGTPSKAEPAFWTGGTIPWVSAKDMKTARIDQTVDTITEEAVRKSAARKIPARSVLCVMRSGILAHTFPVAVNSVEVTINQDLRALVVREDVNPDYLAHFLRYSGRDILHSCSKHGTTVSSIEASRLDGYEVPLPNREIQSQIVARIDELFTELDTGEEELRRARVDLDTYRKSLLKAAVTGELTGDWRAANPAKESGADLLARILADRRARWEADPKNKGKRYKEPRPPASVLAGLPPTWTVATLEQLTSKIVDGTHHTPTYTTSGVPFLSVKDVRDGLLYFDDCKYISAEEHDRLIQRCHPEKGDLLVTKSGTIGRTAIVRVGETFSLFVSVALLKPASGGLAGDWLEFAFHHWFRTKNVAQDVKGSAIKNLHLEDLRPLIVPLPPVEEQHEILSTHARMEARVLSGAMDQVTYVNSTLRQSILAAAFRGELVQ